ncbi:MAG: hypothetical protein R3336_09985, partial [Phycisphaeraceae bacterium]|nr:hypothetical protein [Phycisphaeraceae bacterium]
VDILQTDPILARWQVEGAAALWRQRLFGRERAIIRKSALQSLATIGHTAAGPRMLELAGDRMAAVVVRLAAAEAAGKLQIDGALSLAQRLVEGSWVERLAAAHLVAEDSSTAGLALRIQLAGDERAVVVRRAVGAQIKIDPAPLKPLVDELSRSIEPMVRRQALTVARMLRVAEHIPAVATLLSDQHPEVRIDARETMVVLGETDGLRDPVLAATMEVVTGGEWWGQKQAVQVIARLDHDPAAPVLVEMLVAENDQALEAVAAAVRVLDVADQLGPSLTKAEALVAVIDTHNENRGASPLSREKVRRLNDGLNQLHQWYGQRTFAPADEYFRQFIPKHSGFYRDTRAGAIWALGHLYADRPDGNLVNLLVGRMEDDVETDPERDIVRAHSAIALGRMNARRMLGRIKTLTPAVRGTYDDISLAARWAVSAITGEPPTPIITSTSEDRRWFLTPIN